MSVPYLTIAEALAARYAPAAVTPPAGYGNVVSSMALLENNIINFPIVAIFPPPPGEGEVTYDPGRRVTTIPFLVRFYFDQASGDLAKVTRALYAWATVLYDQTHGASKLGVDGVMKAIPTSPPGFGSAEYAATRYDIIEWTVTVWFEDVVTLTP